MRLDRSASRVARIDRVHDGLDELLELVNRSRRLVVLSGAGCSTGSGIPDYRDRDGEWKRKPPVRLSAMNPTWQHHHASYAPDGDADLDGVRFEAFQVPECARCSGTLKPDVVFFGESVPQTRVDEAMANVDASDLLLVVGSSLRVWSGYRFVKRARDAGIPIAAVNLGKTRADAEIGVKVRADCGEVLQAVVRALPA